VLLTFVQAVVMVTGAVVISSQTTSTRAANLLASFVILPMAMLVIVESLIMVQPDVRYVLWWIMLGMAVTIVLLLRTGTRIFNREELLGRAIDQLNLRWAWRVLAEQWTGGVEGFKPLAWYRYSVWPALKGLRRPMLVFIMATILAFIAGWTARDTWSLPLDSQNMNNETTLDNLRNVFEIGRGNPTFMLFALTQNVRVLVLATFLAIFTFGVLGLIFTCLPFAVLGYVMGNISAAGISPWPFVLAIVPHGVAEIPAIMIAGAAALQLGSIVTRPPRNMSVGEAWLRQFADTVKLGSAVVFPLLIVAAFLEVHLTPIVVEWALTL
jgi:uncharacterized membrane protein SpoIIM required for sporulation